MAPSKANKQEVNPWGWIYSVPPEKVELEHLLQVYRVIGFKPCEEQKRNCKKNPYCCWGLGEKKWVQDSDEEEYDDDGFRNEGEFAGLQNLGATCYVNSLLQLWFHNPILRPAILKWQPLFGDEDLENYKPKCAIAQLQAMFARMKMSKQSKIDPTEFVSSLKLDTGEQQDAQEFSKLFMEVIIKLLTEYGDAEVKNSVGTAFRGELQNETECLGCNNKTQREESFSELELGVRKNLNESLDELLKEEVLNDSNQYFCSCCQMKRDASRRTKLLKLPPVLNLQLMRFVFDRETYRKKKVTTTIQFPEILDMTSRIQGNDSENDSQEKLIYHLTAVLIHNGPSASSGHYVAQIKDVGTGVWLKFNDENVDKVGRVKSTKLVLKDDEPESDGEKSEKKGKSNNKKKTGNGSGKHKSQGAYMLVYTLENYVNNPEADPEMWPFLENLIKQEDQTFEEELKKNKNDKDYEIGLKEQRKSEIAILYPTLNLNPKIDLIDFEDKTTPDDEDDEDYQPPKSKLPRADNTNGKATKSKNANNSKVEEPTPEPEQQIQEMEMDLSQNETIKVDCENDVIMSNGKVQAVVNGDVKSNGENNIKLANEANKDTSEESKYDIDFISTEWLQSWLDVNNPPPPIENSMLKCEHNKLAPPTFTPAITQCFYRIVPTKFANVLYENYDQTGPRFKGVESFCQICVQKECGRLRDLHGLDEDYKIYMDLFKRSEVTVAQYVKNPLLNPMPLSVREGYCWIMKDTNKNWKRFAKKRIEDQYSGKKESQLLDSESIINESEGKDKDAVDEESNSDEQNGPLNAEVVCHHNRLCTDESGRRMILAGAWSIINKHFPDAITISGSETVPCHECLNEKEETSLKVQKNKDLASIQKTVLNDLYHQRNRPDIDSTGEIYIVPKAFPVTWRKFISNPTKHQPVLVVENRSLLCRHGDFMYPLMLIADISKGVGDEDEPICLVSAAEWDFIKKNFTVDTEIKITVNIPKSSIGLKYSPTICDECSVEWYVKAYKEKFIYENEPIYVALREYDEHCEPSDEDDDLFIPIQTTLPTSSNRREKKDYNPMDWKNPSWLKNNQNEKLNQKGNGGIRRSARPRRQKGVKTYKVSSKLTIKDLKVMILRDFKALPSDQHLFYDRRELTKGSQTLEDYEILPRASIYLEIDTANKGEDEPVNVIPEMGFQGTLLMGGSQGGSDFIPIEKVASPIREPEVPEPAIEDCPTDSIAHFSSE